MSRGSSDSLPLRHLHTLYGAGTLGNQSDGELLNRFLSANSETAEASFAALVERHGPMVLRVCQQVLGNAHDAQDAFQATFFVLVRHAASLRKQESLASWLYGVAQRIAWRARANRIRRHTHEQRMAARMANDPPLAIREEESWPELHEEVARLPRKYRDSIVLCYLEGLTTDAAARQLGCPQGTILSRLARARAQLKTRLSRRGLVIPAGFGGSLLPPGTTEAAAFTSISRQLTQIAMQIHAGNAAITSSSTAVKSLTEGMLKIMLRAKLTRTAGALFGVGALVVGIEAFVYGTRAERPDPVAPKFVPPSGSKTASQNLKSNEGPGEIIVRAANLARDGNDDPFMGIVAVNPETGKWRTLYKGVAFGPLSPDGRFIVASPRPAGRRAIGSEEGVWIHEFLGKRAPRRIFHRSGELYWSHGGRKIVIAVPVSEKKFETWIVDIDGSHATRLPIPETDLVLDCSRDGTWLATRTLSGDAPHQGRHTLVHPDGSNPRQLMEGSPSNERFLISRFSPDSQSLAYVEIKTEGKVQKSRLYVDNIDGKNRRLLPVEFGPGTMVTLDWSPDGSKLVLNLMENQTKEASIAIVNIDGTGYRKLPLSPGRWNLLLTTWAKATPEQPLRDEILDAPSYLENRNTFADRCRVLFKENKQALKALREKFREDMTNEERANFSKENEERLRSYSSRFLALAESAPEDPAAMDCLIWILENHRLGPDLSRAMELLAEKHANRIPVAHAALGLSRSFSPDAGKLFRAILAKNPRPNIQGQVCLALGRYFKQQAEMIVTAKESPWWAKSMETPLRESGAAQNDVDRYFQADPSMLTKQAEAQFERIVHDFNNLPGGEGPLGEAARSELHEIRDLAVGKPAPEISGTDLDDLPLKLSDTKGKVVALVFWASWCGTYRGLFADERSLTTMMHDRPFVVLGINNDEDRNKARDHVKKDQVTWRSWFDGGGNFSNLGPISREFNIGMFPTIYLLDHQGVIRHKFRGSPGGPTLGHCIQRLVKDAENADQTKNKIPG